MYNRKSIIQPVLLALVLALGFALVIGIIDGWVMSTVYEIVRKKADDTPYKHLVILADGTPVIRYENNPKLDQFLNGEPAASKQALPRLEGAEFIGNARLESVFDDYDKNRIYRVSAYSQYNPNWFFLYDGRLDGKGYFVGYDKKTNLCIGYIGLQGLSGVEPPPEKQFPVDGLKMGSGYVSHNVYVREPAALVYPGANNYNLLKDFPYDKVFLISGNKLLGIDLQTGDHDNLLDAPDLISASPIHVAENPNEKPDEKSFKIKQQLAVRTNDRIVILDVSGKQIDSYALPQDYRNKGFTFYKIAANQAIMQQPGSNLSAEKLIWIDTSGKILREEKIGSPSSKQNSQRSTKYESWTAFAMIPEPAVMIGIPVIASCAIYYNESGPDSDVTYIGLLTEFLKDFEPSLVIVFCIGAVLAWFCYKRQSRMAQPWTWIWVIFVFLFGVPGFLAYLYHRRWPVLEKCPACGNLVPHDREACSSCGAEFPKPKPKGIEVFA